MAPGDIEIVRLVFDAFNSEDIERVLALTHADCEIEVPPELSAEPDVYRGHAGMRRYFSSFQDAMDEIRFQSEGFWDAGESVVVAMHLTARGRRTEIPVELRTAGVWTIRDGRALRIRVYAELTEALDAVGLSE